MCGARYLFPDVYTDNLSSQDYFNSPKKKLLPLTRFGSGYRTSHIRRGLMRYKNKGLQGVKRASGSITAEAALGLPLFFFALLAVCRMFTCIETEYMIRTAMFEAAREMSCSAVLMEKVTGAVEETVKATVTEALSDKTDEEKKESSKESSKRSSKDGGKAGSRDESDGSEDVESEIDPEDKEKIKDAEELLKAEAAAVTEFAGMVARRAAETAYIGDAVMSRLNAKGFALSLVWGGTAPTGLKVENISFAGSEITDGKVLDIRFSCKLMIPTVIMGTIGYPIKEELRYRVFSGLSVKSLLACSDGENGEAAGRQVYITEKGSVYHTSSDCPVLKITTRSVPYSRVGSERSDSGAKYYPCEKCAKGSPPATVFVTSDGNRYHCRLDCSALKRSVQTVDRNSVGDRSKCKRCPGD